MKKFVCTILALIMVCGMMTPMTANAQSAGALSIVPGLGFDGTTAQCELTVGTDHLSNSITATIKLWNGSSCVATWYKTGSGYLDFYATRTVYKGVTYTLTADVTINGVAQPQFSITRTC